MKSIIQKITFFLLLTTPIAYCFGWWDSGHRSVAEVAYMELTPEAKESVDEIVKIFGQLHSDYVTFADLATWPDHLQDEERAFLYSDLHYVTLPYDPEKILSEESKKDLRAFAMSKGALLSLAQAKAVLKSQESSMLSKCWALSYLAHIIADLHQPMHCCTRFSSDLPEGDRGGNFYSVVAPKEIHASNLHQLWDSGVGLMPVLTGDKSQDAKKVTSFVAELVRELPKEKLSASAILDPIQWCVESHEIAKGHAYTLALNKRPSKTYVKDSQMIVKERIALAGYRLSLALNEIFAREEEIAVAK